MPMTMTFQEAFEVFNRYYPLWSSHPGYRPAAILSAYPDYSGSIRSQVFENVISGIDRMQSDNSLMSIIEKMTKKMGNRRSLHTFLKKIISSGDYATFSQRVRALVPDAFGRNQTQISVSFRGIWDGIDTGTIRGLPDQIKDFYEACFHIVCFLHLSR